MINIIKTLKAICPIILHFSSRRYKEGYGHTNGKRRGQAVMLIYFVYLFICNGSKVLVTYLHYTSHCITLISLILYVIDVKIQPAVLQIA